jgi:hypothetical protein
MRDRFSWPPSRPDFAMYFGVVLVIVSLIAGAWEVALAGVALVVVGLLLPRMRGDVLIDMGKNLPRFRGDFADADEPGPKPLPANDQTAQQEQLPPPAPPTSSRSPEERSSSSDH